MPVLLTAYDIEGRRAFFFRTERARTDPEYDFALADAAQATAAAPTYFEPVRVTDVAGAATYPLVDGGVFAANPAMCAWTDLVRAGAAPEVSVLASLGTGTAIRPIPFDDARRWGLLGWARPLIDVLFSGRGGDGRLPARPDAGRSLRALPGAAGDASDDMDDASPQNLRDLRAEGDLLVRQNTAAIDDLCARLSE